MSKSFFVGPARLFIGDPTQTDGAGMTPLGDTETVTFNPGIAMTGVTTAQTHDAYDADGIYTLPPNPNVQAELYESDLDKMLALVLGGENIGTSGIGFGGPIEKVASVPTLAVIPEFELSQGEEAPHGIWIPAAVVEDLSGIVYNRMTSGGNSGNTYSVTFRAARRLKDQGDTDIPTKAQFAFMGTMTDLGLTWSLPSA